MRNTKEIKNVNWASIRLKHKIFYANFNAFYKGGKPTIK